MLRLSSIAIPLATAALLAQTDEIPTFKADTRLVVLHASVVDHRGRLLTNLPESAFKVYENGAEQNIKLFRREDVPVSMGLVIDNSGSMRDKRTRVERAAIDLVKASNPQDEVFIVNFNDEAYLDVEFTNDVHLMEQGIARIDSRGGTALRDSIDMSMDYLKQKGKKDKKVLLVITDGNDTASNDRDTLERLVLKARQSEVLIFAVGLLSEEDPHDAKKAKRVLRELTEASGGLAYYPKELAEVDDIALRVAQEIRNQYIIAYTSTNPALDNTFRQIRVTVKGPGSPTVRTRTGYYATPAGVKESKNTGVGMP
ncbi:MAG TPA: VWA domain-containing protein [Bryobacteraceae bacterium]|nr:VWA domain-containing protein [Bryobacteraceae bacterium]